MKTGYYLELLTLETMKLLGSTKSKITKDKNGEKKYIFLYKTFFPHFIKLFTITQIQIQY